VLIPLSRRKILAVDVSGYVESVRERLRRAGFREEASPAGAILKARRRQVKLSRFGVVETVAVISSPRSQVEPDQLRMFGAESVRAATAGKTRLPLGLGSSLVVYPVLLLDVISDPLTRFVNAYVPKHWSIVEFPVVVVPAAQTLVFATKTPVWGSAYYRKTRREAQDLLAPT
jgi:hypothetical protein